MRPESFAALHNNSVACSGPRMEKYRDWLLATVLRSSGEDETCRILGIAV